MIFGNAAMVHWYVIRFAADPGSNPSASTKMKCLIFGFYGCVGYENDCGEDIADGYIHCHYLFLKD